MRRLLNAVRDQVREPEVIRDALVAVIGLGDQQVAAGRNLDKRVGPGGVAGVADHLVADG
jgi:hypothetical protein